jgi:hypothetical protein
MKQTLILSALLLVGCAQIETKAPELTSLPFDTTLVKTVQQQPSRVPASVVEEGVGKSPRRVYFSALYHQYVTLGNALQEKNTVKFCPQFHHDKIETDALPKPHVTFAQKAQVDVNGVVFFPEFAFDKKHPLSAHYQNLMSEVKTLCEDGVSEQFYTFDNLITHFSGKKSFHSSASSMTAMLKISVFANFYLLQMLQDKSFAHSDEERLIELTGTQWFGKYVAEARTKRQAFLKQTIVKR